MKVILMALDPLLKVRVKVIVKITVLQEALVVHIPMVVKHLALTQVARAIILLTKEMMVNIQKVTNLYSVFQDSHCLLHFIYR